MQQIDLYEKLSKTYDVIIEDNEVNLTKDVIADKSDLINIAQELKESGFDMLRLISSVDYVENNTASCEVYNEAKECSVTLPNFNKIGYENKGYSTSKESLSGFKFPGDEYLISHDTIIYPIYTTSARNKSLEIVKTLPNSRTR